MSSWSTREPLRFYDRNEGGVVCYGVDSGDTHLVSAAAASILRSLQDEAEPVADDSLIIVLSSDDQVALDSEQVRSLLVDLAGAGLVVSQ